MEIVEQTSTILKLRGRNIKLFVITGMSSFLANNGKGDLDDKDVSNAAVRSH